MRRVLLLLFLFTYALVSSQEYKITKVNGWNVRFLNSRVMIKDDFLRFTYRKRPPVDAKIINVEVKDDKKYFYAEVEPPLEQLYYILYKNRKKIILEQYMIVNGDNIEIKMQLSQVD
tara:strand:- start:2439 stop:2789 length:351 start_codon:yes stop_codon:yes gene_type:complete